MADFFRFMAVYRTQLITGPFFKAVIDPVKIEYFKGPKSYSVPLQIVRVFPITTFSQNLGEPGQLTLRADERYITITSRDEDSLGASGLDNLENEVDTAVAYMSTLLQPELFMEQVYRGPVLGGKKFVVSATVRAANTHDISEPWLQDSLGKMAAALDPGSDLDKRYRLMSRFYSKSLAYASTEEQFLLLWTTLEIYPMQGSNIKKLSDLLAHIVGKPEDETKEKLQLGKLTRWRGSLVHNGMLPAISPGRSEMFGRLERIVKAVMRSMCSLPYDGSLDRYWTEECEDIPAPPKYQAADTKA